MLKTRMLEVESTRTSWSGVLESWLSSMAISSKTQPLSISSVEQLSIAMPWVIQHFFSLLISYKTLFRKGNPRLEWRGADQADRPLDVQQDSQCACIGSPQRAEGAHLGKLGVNFFFESINDFYSLFLLQLWALWKQGGEYCCFVQQTTSRIVCWSLRKSLLCTEHWDFQTSLANYSGMICLCAFEMNHDDNSFTQDNLTCFS